MGAQEDLRGNIQPGGPGARGLLRTAKLDCHLQAAMSFACADPTAVYKLRRAHLSEQQENIPEEPPVSSLANWLGQRFENRLLANGAALLKTKYKKTYPQMENAKVLPIQRRPLQRSDYRNVARDTYRCLKTRQSEGNQAIFITNAVLTMQFGDERTYIKPDVLVGLPGEPIAVGEIKVYLDRSSRTDPDELETACFQAAVGTVALCSVGIAAANKAHIVLRHGTEPSLRIMDISDEIEIVSDMLKEAPTRAAELLVERGNRHLHEIEHNWTPRCASSCPLEPTCRPADVVRHTIDEERQRLAITEDEWKAVEREMGWA